MDRRRDEMMQCAAALAGILTALVLVSLLWLLAPAPALADQPVSGGAPKYTIGAESGDPIWMNSGAFGFSLPLLRFNGPLPVDIALSYRVDNGFIQSRYVPGFQFGFLPSLNRFGRTSRQESIEVEGIREGELIRFGLPSGGDWTLTEPAQVRYGLVETPGYYYLFDPSTERLYYFERYDQNDNTRIRGFQDRNGNQWTYVYGTAIYSLPARMEDGLGRTLVFTYTGTPSRLSQATDQGGRFVTLTYSGTRLIAVTDPLSQTTGFDRDPARSWAITAVTMPLGTVQYRQVYTDTDLNFRTATRVLTQVDAYGNTRRFAYDRGSIRVTETTPLSTTVVYEHYFHFQNNGALKSVTDATGRTASFGVDARQQTTGITDRLGATSTITYNQATGNLAGATNARGDVLAYSYSSQEQVFTNPFLLTESITLTFSVLSRIDYPDGTNERYTYDSRGNVLTRIDQGGNTWTYTYNSRGQLLTATNPAGGVTTNTYNTDGTLATSTDSDTGTTTYTYDAYKRPTVVTYPDGSTVQTTYDLIDRITAVTDERGNTTRYTYDANGNRTQVTDAAGQVIRYGYDLMDRLVGATDRGGRVTTYSYDAIGRTSIMTDAAGITTVLSYDPRGWLDRTTRGEASWQTTYNAEGLATGGTSPAGRGSQTSYDALGNATGVTNPLSQTATLTRDSRQRVTSVTNPLSQTHTYTYEARGLLAGVTLASGAAASYQYDALGSLSRITDLAGQTWTFTRTAMGRLAALRDPLGRVTQYSYDNRGRLSQTAFPDSTVVTRTYDAVGNLTRLVGSDGTDVQNTYDALGQLTGTTGQTLTYDAESRVTATADGSASYGATYDAAGRVQTATYNNGTFTVTYSYSPTTGLLMRVADSLASAAVDFTYDADFRRTGVRRSNGVNATFGYDAASRLTGIQDSSVLDLQYGLDAASRVVSLTRVAPLDPGSLLASGTTPVTVDAAAQLNSSGYAYDSQGRQSAAPNATYTWDVLSRLTRAGETMLTYNGLDQVRTRAAGGTTTRFLYNRAIGLASIVAEQDAASGQVLRYYVWTPDGRLLYGIDVAAGNKVFFYHFDRTGSTLALTDGSGAVADAYAYTPYGQVLGRTGSSAQPFTFVGEWGVRQEGSGGTLYQMRARYYDAMTGRFLTKEPLWPTPNEPKQLNPYQYATGDPLGRVDPTGLDDTTADDRWRQEIRDYLAAGQAGTRPLNLVEWFQEQSVEEQTRDKAFSWVDLDINDPRSVLNGHSPAEQAEMLENEINSALKDKALVQSEILSYYNRPVQMDFGGMDARDERDELIMRTRQIDTYVSEMQRLLREIRKKLARSSPYGQTLTGEVFKVEEHLGKTETSRKAARAAAGGGAPGGGGH